MSVSPPQDQHDRSRTPPPGRGDGKSRVLTLVFTDIVGSVALKGKLGDVPAGQLLARHFSHLRTLAFETGGREIVALGDGLLLSFETPTAAVEFALGLQNTHFQHRDLPAVRIGVHLGEVTEYETAGTLGGVTLEGLAVDICSRIQNLALSQQILLSYAVFDNARQRLQADQLGFSLAWRAHGQYTFKGQDQALDIYEAGIEGLSPLQPPENTDKARRDVDEEAEPTLGWRPAQGLQMPERPNWILTEKLGEGGFGDVWMAEQRKTQERRVIKFCYSPDHLRALKREVTLFRLLKESLGDRDDIARVVDYQFEQSPFFLEMEYGGQCNFKEWLERPNLGATAPLEIRLGIVAQVAEALGAAHSAGVLHKDIKLNNILISSSGIGQWKARVIDFGIGGLVDRGALDARGITSLGMTETTGTLGPSSMSGTRLYMAPELIEGKPATIQSDIYSLGVVLYQAVTGRVDHALATGWERDIQDELLRQDIASCVDGAPERRFSSARELADRLRNLPQRTQQRRTEMEWEEARLRARRRRPLYWVAAGGVFFLSLLGGLFTWELMQRVKSEGRLRAMAEASTMEAREQAAAATQARLKAERESYFSTVQTAASSLRENQTEKAREVLLGETPESLRQIEWGWLYAQTAQENFSLRGVNAYDAVFSPDGTVFATGDRDNKTSGTGWVTIYHAQTGNRLRGAQVHGQLIWDLRFSPDGTKLVTASSDRTAAIVDVQTLQVLARMEGHSALLRAAAFTPDSSRIVTAARDETIRFWNPATGAQVMQVRTPGESVADLQVSPKGATFVTTALGGIVRQRSATTGEVIASFQGHHDSVLSACFGPNGDTFVTACKDGLLRTFDYNEDGGTSEVLAKRTSSMVGSWPAAVSYSPRGNFLAVALDNGRCRTLDFDTLSMLVQFQTDQPAWKIKVSPDGKSVMTTSRWSVRNFSLDVLTHEQAIDTYRGDPLSSDVRRLRATSIVQERDPTWRLDRDWRTTAGRTLVTVQGEKFAVDSFFSVFSPDSKQCIRINEQTLSGTVLEVPSARVVAELKAERICDATFSADGTHAATAGMQSRAQIWDSSTWNQLHLLDRGSEFCSTLKFSPDGKRVAVGYTDGIIIFWSIATGQPVLTTGGHGHRVLSLDFSPDGSFLVSGHSSDRAMVWDAETGQQISTMTGHVRYVHSVAFSPDGARVLTCARDGKAKLWDTQTGKELATVFETTGSVQMLTGFFAPDSYHLGAITSDRRLLLSNYFPWRPRDYPGSPETPFTDRIELWKRRQRIDSRVQLSDLQTR